MNEVKMIEHKGKKILSINFPSTSKKEDVLAIIKEAKEMIACYPTNSVLTITNMGDFHFDKLTAQAFKEYVHHNKPYVKGAAVLGITGLKKIIYNSVISITGRKMKLCNSIAEGLEYLTSLE